MTTIDGLDALRAKAAVHDKTDAMDQFRTDFALVYQHERGYLNDQELADAKAHANRYVRDRMGDAKAMREMMTMFKDMADRIRRDQSRAERIRAEVRAERREA